jgi:hypothetical protein
MQCNRKHNILETEVFGKNSVSNIATPAEQNVKVIFENYLFFSGQIK